MSGIWKISIILLIPHSILSYYELSSPIEIIFETNSVVPDVISIAPKYKLWVKYPSGAEVEFGNELTPTQVKDIPLVSWPWQGSHDVFYTLAMVDPDAPSRCDPTYRNWKHWLVGNIPGHHVVSGEVIAEYVGAAPPMCTGFHRYVLLVYKQPARLAFYEPRLNNRSTANRTNFSISGFAKKYNLGNPIAGNFFYAQYDDYVPILNKQLGS